MQLMIINQHLRNRGQILSVAMPVIQPAFIRDKGLNSMLCHSAFAFNRRRFCFNGVWRLSAVQMAAPNCSLFNTDTEKNWKNASRFSSKHSDWHEICQTTLFGDFPKGYNHQLLCRNAFQKANLVFSSSHSKYCVITAAAASDLYVKSLGNCLEVCTDK